MKPVDQTSFYEPGKATGDCMRACVASILELPIEQVPHFAYDDDGERDESEFWNRYIAFLRSRGFVFIRCSATTPGLDTDYIACGPGPRGCGHAVVYRQGVMVHDPHPSRAGLTEVHYAHVLVPIAPARQQLSA